MPRASATHSATRVTTHAWLKRAKPSRDKRAGTALSPLPTMTRVPQFPHATNSKAPTKALGCSTESNVPRHIPIYIRCNPYEHESLARPREPGIFFASQHWSRARQAHKVGSIRYMKFKILGTARCLRACGTSNLGVRLR